MTGQDGLRDEERHALTIAYHDAYCIPSCGDDVSTYRPIPERLAEAFERIVQARIDAAREQVAEQIAQTIEARARADLQLAPGWMAAEAAAGIARQHAKGGSHG